MSQRARVLAGMGGRLRLVAPERVGFSMSAAPARSWELGKGAADGKAHARLFLHLQLISAANCSDAFCQIRKNES